MTRITSGLPANAPAAPASQDEKLRAVTKQLEGVFVQQLFKAMRETVPQDGLADGGAGEEMFTGMMDENIAMHVPEHWERGLGESLYKQLRAVLPHANPGAAATDADDKRIK